MAKVVQWLYFWYLVIVPNLIANVVWIPIVGGFQIVSHILHKRHADRRHEEIKQHITEQIRKGRLSGDEE